jgi:hypothetical protein
MMFFAMLSPIPGTSLYSADQRFVARIVRAAAKRLMETRA